MRIRFGLAIVLAAVAWLAGPALAWEPISVEVGKSKLVRLKEDQQPAVVFVGNPFVADVIIERGGVIFVLGREPGETDVWILDDEGKALLHRPLVVTALASRQVTLSRGGTGQEQTYACNPRCSLVETPVGDNRGPTGQQAGALFSNPPAAKKPITTEELIESLKELIPELAESSRGANGGAGKKAE